MKLLWNCCETIATWELRQVQNTGPDLWLKSLCEGSRVFVLIILITKCVMSGQWVCNRQLCCIAAAFGRQSMMNERPAEWELFKWQLFIRKRLNYATRNVVERRRPMKSRRNSIFNGQKLYWLIDIIVDFTCSTVLHDPN